MSNLDKNSGSYGQKSHFPASYRYSLEPYSGRKSRHTCPECHKQGKFTLYIDTTTGKAIAPKVGKCSRLKKCGYHYPPRQYFERNPDVKQMPTKELKRVIPTPKATSFHSFDLAVHHSREEYRSSNNFYQFLCRLLGKKWADTLTALYLIGTASDGRTIFWQIDEQRKVRAGKVMPYNAATGKRKKWGNNWIHSLEIKKGLREEGSFNLEQCLFGMHIVSALPKNYPIGIVESEKTAILLTALVPGLCWLATGGLNNLKLEKLLPLAGRPVVLFPDAGCYDDWEAKATELRCNDLKLPVSTHLRDTATDEQKADGIDLADYFIFIQRSQSMN